MKVLARRRGAVARRGVRPGVEGLEDRALLATVTVNAGQVVRPVSTQLLGVNLVWWDSNLNTAQTKQMVQAAGLTMFRFPGGSSSDDFHFNAGPTYNGQGTDSSIESFISSVNGIGMATTDYGSGSPQEAAAFLAYMNAPVGSTAAIGTGQEWSDSAGAWQQVNWQNAGYWAGLRAQSPLPTDDGLNFLRLGHAAPFGVHYWEVGNEEYGSWEVDHHGQGSDPGKQHDPATYVGFARTFAALAAQIDPTISIGVDTGSVSSDNNWTPNVLQQSAAQGFTPGFLSDHNYVQAPGSENDSTLLLHTVSDPTNQADDWAARASGYRSILAQYLGAAGNGVQLLATEFNSVYSNPGKQTTSLVNGLFVADSIGSLLETPYNGADVWDLRNSYDTGNNNSSSLYGWRQGGDYGLIGSPNGSAPSTGAYVPYPTYFAEQLASKIVVAGGSVVQASSSDPNLSTYAVVEANGDLELLVINKSASGALTGQFQVAGFQPSGNAVVWQYGEAQDTAQSQTADGHSALANSTATLTLNGSSFSASFPAYSMTVLDLGRASAGPTIVRAAAANPNPVTGKTAALSVSATDPSGAAGLTYTWATVGTPPAPVSFATNGTNASQSDTATFAKAGSYTIVVTVTDPAGLSATSTVTVLVNATLTTVTVSPGSAVVKTGGIQAFAALGYDQFGNPLGTQPTFAWSVVAGVGSIGAGTGLYAAPSTPGTATVQAAAGGVAGTASVTVVQASANLLSGSFNRTGIVADGSAFAAGFDGASYALSANLLGGSVSSGGVTFPLGAPGGNDVVAAAGQVIALPPGSYSTLSLLGAGVYGGQVNQAFTVTYTDGTSRTFVQSLSDWWSPQGFAGETVAATEAYIDGSGGGRLGHAVDLYRYDFALDPGRTVASIALPNNAHVVLLSAVFQVAPALRVADGSTTIVNGGADAFGSTAVGSPLTRTFTVTNAGSAPLTLSDPIAVPAGFSLVADFGSLTLSPGASTTFALRLVASASGSYSGPVSFATNDPANSTFTFNVSGSVLSSANLLSGSFNRTGIVADGSAFATGFDGGSYALSANLLGSSLTSGGVTFGLGGPGGNDVVAAAGQVIAVAPGSYSTLSFLGAGVYGGQVNQAFTVTYTDGTTRTYTQSLSDWWSPQGFAGEAVAATEAYIDTGSGGRSGQSVDLYRYDFALDPGKVVASITLPNNPHVVLLSAVLH